MNVLVVGGGGREHALCWKLAQSPHLTRLVAAPGNPGIARHSACVGVSVDDHDGLVRLADKEHPELIVIGPASWVGALHVEPPFVDEMKPTLRLVVPAGKK